VQSLEVLAVQPPQKAQMHQKDQVPQKDQKDQVPQKDQEAQQVPRTGRAGTQVLEDAPACSLGFAPASSAAPVSQDPPEFAPAPGSARPTMRSSAAI
jgi:hypothetical protein